LTYVAKHVIICIKKWEINSRNGQTAHNVRSVRVSVSTNATVVSQGDGQS